MKKSLILLLGTSLAFTSQINAGKEEDDALGEAANRVKELSLQSYPPKAAIRTMGVSAADADATWDFYAKAWESGKTAAQKALRSAKAVKEIMELVWTAGGSDKFVRTVLSTTPAHETIATRDKLEALGVWDEMPLVKAHLRPHMHDTLFPWIDAHEGAAAGTGLLGRLAGLHADAFFQMLEGLIQEQSRSSLPFLGAHAWFPFLADINTLPLGYFDNVFKQELFSIGASFSFMMDDRTVAAHGADGAATRAGLTPDQQRDIGADLVNALQVRGAFTLHFSFKLLERIATSSAVQTPSGALVRDHPVVQGALTRAQAHTGVKRS